MPSHAAMWHYSPCIHLSPVERPTLLKMPHIHLPHSPSTATFTHRVSCTTAVPYCPNLKTQPCSCLLRSLQRCHWTGFERGHTHQQRTAGPWERHCRPSKRGGGEEEGTRALQRLQTHTTAAGTSAVTNKTVRQQLDEHDVGWNCRGSHCI